VRDRQTDGQAKPVMWPTSTATWKILFLTSSNVFSLCNNTQIRCKINPSLTCNKQHKQRQMTNQNKPVGDVARHAASLATADFQSALPTDVRSLLHSSRIRDFQS